METAALSPLREWGDRWVAAAAKAGIDSAVPQRKLGRDAHFEEDSYWSPLSEAGMILAGTGAKILTSGNQSKKSLDEAKARLAELSAGLREAKHDALATYLHVTSFMLAGLASWTEGRPEAAVANLTAAIKLQEPLAKNQKASDPTLLFIPSWELLGQLALVDADVIAPIVSSSKELASALGTEGKVNASSLFSRSLEVRPGRGASLLGRCRALELEGAKTSAVDACWDKLDRQWKGADAGVRGVLRK